MKRMRGKKIEQYLAQQTKVTVSQLLMTGSALKRLALEQPINAAS